VIFHIIVKPLYSCISLLQQQFIWSVGETTYTQYFVHITLTLHIITFILVGISVITVICVVLVDDVAVVAVVFVATVGGISIVTSSAITAKLDK